MENKGRASGVPDFGALLRRHRIAAGLSQEALAELARMSTGGVGALERGDRRTPQRETLSLLARALALDEDEQLAFQAAAASSRAPRLPTITSLTLGPCSNSRLTKLPFALTSFVGRGIEVEEIEALVHSRRFVTLTGAGGIGKTQTALHVGRAFSAGGAGVLSFIGLATTDDPSLVVGAIASTLGVQEVSQRPLLETVVAYLKSKPMLLILDNCEQVVSEAACVAHALLANCPKLHILATSREPLKAAGEYAYRLPSLRLSNAAVLFADRAQAVDHRFHLTRANASTVTDLCKRLDGIPLAIELAAARVNVLSLKELVTELDDRLTALSGGRHTSLPRQQAMRATIDWSYNLLSSQEQLVFERLAVFAGSAELGAARSVCAGEGVEEHAILNLMASLVDKSLIVADLEGRQPRYRMLEAFRQYASEKLAAHAAWETVRRRHAMFYLELAEQLMRARATQPQSAWLSARMEIGNWRAAIQWALNERGDVLLGQRLVAELVGIAGPLHLGGRHLVVSALERVDEHTPASIFAKLKHAEAQVAKTFCEFAVQLTSSERAINLYREVGDTVGVATTKTLAGHALACLGRAREAKAILEEALSAARGSSDRLLVAWILRTLAFTGTIADDLDASPAYLGEALAIYEAAGAKDPVPWALEDCADYAFAAGNPTLALDYATEMLAAAREHNPSPHCIATALNAMSVYLIALDRYDEAEEYAQQALELAREWDLSAFVAWSLHNLGAIGALRPYAAGESAQSGRRHAARILGFVDARLTAMGSMKLHIQMQGHDRALAALRDAMGSEAAANLMAVGGSMTEEQALEEASSPPDTA